MTRWHGKSTTQRGYGSEHQKLHAQWEPLVDAGMVTCHETICLMPSRWIQPGTPWHLGHTPDGTTWIGPVHQRCNIAESNRRRRGRRTQQPMRWVTSRQW
jgi:hypothetical protein